MTAVVNGFDNAAEVTLSESGTPSDWSGTTLTIEGETSTDPPTFSGENVLSFSNSSYSWPAVPGSAWTLNNPPPELQPPFSGVTS